ncbi:4390_t:CDS:2 [Funneliformis geosporum]|uniref:4390_t:CDS:1 n=1 Tax=Funneliformis geosporum TaxID=1117311 RepID=A0A9W4WTS5_9GLOM|nr:4390_t:CDS:2 [Funneliformis geosporum]
MNLEKQFENQEKAIGTIIEKTEKLKKFKDEIYRITMNSIISEVFYKRISKVDSNDIITYYQKDISRNGDFVVEFELTEADVVAKRDDGR